MKKVICLIGLIFILMAIASPAIAAENSYDLPEIDISVEIPDSYVVITKETIDSVIDEYVGTDIDSSEREALKESLLSSGVYMLLWSQDDFELTIIAQDNSYKNESFANYSDSQIKEEYGTGLKDTLEQRGATVIGEPEIYQHSQIKMCKIAYSLTTDGTTRYLLSYSTVLNGKTYNFLFSSYKPILHQTSAVTAKEIIDGVHFNKMSSSSSSPSSNISGYSSNSRTKSFSFAGAILLGLIITFVIHPLPIIIYRYGIKKEPVAPNKAKKIVIIDAIIVFFVWVGINAIFISSTGSTSSSISTPAIIIWAFICHSILTNGYSQAPNNDDEAEEIVKGTCEHDGVMGTLDCGNSFIRFTSASLLEEMYRFEDGIKVSLDDDVVTIIDNKNDKHIFKVKSPELFRSKIDNYNKSPEQAADQITGGESSSLKGLPLEVNNNQEVVLDTKETDNERTHQPDNHIQMNAQDSSMTQALPLETVNQQENKPEILFCRKCGSKLIMGSAFCRKCGTPVVENKEKNEQVLKKTKKEEPSSAGTQNNVEKKVLEYNFANQDEFIIYILTNKDSIQDDKLIWTKGNQYMDAYNKGYALFEKRQYNAALSAYKEALEYNPVGLAARFEIVECLIVQRRNTEAKEMLLGDLISYAQYNPTTLARAYRRLGFIYTEQKKYELAKASYLYSSKIEKNDSVIDELTYIMSVSKDKNLDIDIRLLLTRDKVPMLTVRNIYDQLEQKQGDNTKAEYTMSQKNEGYSGTISKAEKNTLQPNSPESDSKTVDEIEAADGVFKKELVEQKQELSNSATSDNALVPKDNKKKETQKTDEKKVEYIFCRKCGKKIPADSDFCTHCGTTVIHLE